VNGSSSSFPAKSDGRRGAPAFASGWNAEAGVSVTPLLALDRRYRHREISRYFHRQAPSMVVALANVQEGLAE
jgi:hypothetical protein